MPQPGSQGHASAPNSFQGYSQQQGYPQAFPQQPGQQPQMPHVSSFPGPMHQQPVQQQPQQSFYMPQPFVPQQPQSGQYNSIPAGYQQQQQQPAAMPQVRQKLECTQQQMHQQLSQGPEQTCSVAHPAADRSTMHLGFGVLITGVRSFSRSKVAMLA
jgi:hypothetical protein